MLPAIIVTFTTFLLELCSSSPVYNMQPAHITANIGTMGRNIRNLPCISRKTSQSGVCMFAIDCLKANGTHLGTCIDRFYFGSCCRIEPLNEIIDNSIESIIPARVPPHRITATTAISTTSVHLTGETTKIPQRIETTAKRKPTTESITVSTTTEKIQAATKNEVTATTTPFITTKKVQTTVSTKATTEVPQKLTTFQSVNGNISNDITSTLKPKTTTKSTKPTLKPIPSKPISQSTAKPIQQKPKPSVKPILQNSTKPSVTKPTSKPVSKPTHKPKPVRPASTTQKPIKITKPSTVKPSLKPSTKPSTKPSIKPSVKPVKNTTKPIRVTTTRKPPPAVTKIPTLPENSTVKATRKPVSTTKLPVKITTISPLTSSTEKKSSSTTSKTTVKTTKLPETITTSPVIIPSNLSDITFTTTEVALTKVNITSLFANISANLDNNEIESEKPSVTELLDSTTKGTLITWAMVDEKNSSAAQSNGTSEEPEDWVPMTTPDGWVLLPSLPVTSTTPRTNSSSTTESQKTTLSTSSSAEPIRNITSSTTTSTSLSSISVEPTTEKLPAVANVTTDHANNVSTSTTVAPSQPPQYDRPVNMTDFTDVCGRRMYPEARIVGGEKSSFGKWPWQISLRQWRTSTYLHKCGAALLNENWAITAAHCVDNVPPSDLLLRLGEHDLSTEAEPYLHQERRVQIVASHPQFDPRTFEYDLALLRFYEPVTFQPNIIPVCVPQTDENFVGRTAHVTGWGRLYEDGPLPSILQEVSVPVINNTVCESMYRAAGYIEHIPHIFICAGWRRGGFDSCEGDSGGPMVIQRADKRFLLAGVISWGIGCAEPNQPGVYTRISEFRDWINQILQF